ncbi:hypothetical protein SPRG_17708 [Saprolegnia parasitica CBS 223.65]|uniref:Uncharacterized protein n=1 Tax=Saprolegnia parasitica (strain CBS 223.65) TaxID=695850 RepID=A0A067BR74_SAPPC|nr:hypothetical protein SPRG_17708 [Saprolegnia parasitica CBS 223.65]KDO16811.1 hypothetical protein SPRG_17708 [Saprolegnia parasitica CBS 223.65]|eukprot:XP_012212482.1 hypothetical protein SPRG_17708 [Saprolegnia parasitica CBS 223.65]
MDAFLEVASPVMLTVNAAAVLSLALLPTRWWPSAGAIDSSGADDIFIAEKIKRLWRPYFDHSDAVFRHMQSSFVAASIASYASELTIPWLRYPCFSLILVAIAHSYCVVAHTVGQMKAQGQREQWESLRDERER